MAHGQPIMSIFERLKFRPRKRARFISSFLAFLMIAQEFPSCLRIFFGLFTRHIDNVSAICLQAVSIEPGRQPEGSDDRAIDPLFVTISINKLDTTAVP